MSLRFLKKTFPKSIGPEEVLASFELSIIVDGQKCNLRDSKKVCQFAEENHPAWGFKKFIQFDDLQNEEKGFLKGWITEARFNQ